MAKKTRKDILNENKELKNTIESLKQSFENEKATIIAEKDNLLKQKEQKFDSEKQTLDNKIEERDNKIEELEEQRDLQETKKLAKAYEIQKDEYKENAEIWSRRLFWAAVLLTISTGLSIYFSYGKAWYDRFEFYIVDVIFVSAVWFCVSQYSYYVRLYTDFANRQALAQSYHNIINNTEDDEIKDKFLDKTTDILCAKNDIEHKDNLPIEKVLGITKDFIGKLPNPPKI